MSAIACVTLAARAPSAAAPARKSHQVLGRVECRTALPYWTPADRTCFVYTSDDDAATLSSRMSNRGPLLREVPYKGLRRPNDRTGDIVGDGCEHRLVTDAHGPSPRYRALATALRGPAGERLPAAYIYALLRRVPQSRVAARATSTSAKDASAVRECHSHSPLALPLWPVPCNSRLRCAPHRPPRRPLLRRPTATQTIC